MAPTADADTLHRVCLPYATFGLVARAGVVVHTAPIAAWARGKPLAEVAAYYRRKGATVERRD